MKRLFFAIILFFNVASALSQDFSAFRQVTAENHDIGICKSLTSPTYEDTPGSVADECRPMCVLRDVTSNCMPWADDSGIFALLHTIIDYHPDPIVYYKFEVLWGCRNPNLRYVGAQPVWSDDYYSIITNGGCFPSVHTSDQTRRPECKKTVGDPIDPISGTKMEAVDVLAFPDGDIDLKFYYDSSAVLPTTYSGSLLYGATGGAFLRSYDLPSPLGTNWRSNFHRVYSAGVDSHPTGVDFGDGTFGSIGSPSFSISNVTYANIIALNKTVSLPQSAKVDNRFRGDISIFSRKYFGPNSSMLEIQRTTDSGGVTYFEYSDTSTSASVAPGPGYLISIKDRFGRTVQFRYASPVGYKNGLLQKIIDPAGNNIELSYAGENLSSITWQDGTKRRFAYEDATHIGALTSVADENNEIYSTTQYSAAGQVSSTWEGDGKNIHVVTYSSPPGVSQEVGLAGGSAAVSTAPIAPSGVVVTGPNGVPNPFAVSDAGGLPKFGGESQPAGSGCGPASSSRTYDSSGNVSSAIDFNNHQSCFVYQDGSTHLLTKVEGLSSNAACEAVLPADQTLPPGSRKVSYANYWKNTPLSVAEPRKITTRYIDGGTLPGGLAASCTEAGGAQNLCMIVETATVDSDGSHGFNAQLQSGVAPRKRSFTYNKFNQVLSETDSLGHTTTYIYYPDTNENHTLGDLMSTTNAAGQTTSYTKYNPFGLPLEVIDANQITTTYTYNLRQRLTSVSTAGATTNYSYWPTGLLKQVTMPDGSLVAYGYDEAHRLTSVSDGLGNKVVYTLDNAGVRIGEAVQDPSGTLSRTLSRIPDALGRIQQVTGQE